VSESQVDDYPQVQAYRNELFKICTKRDNLPNDGRPVTLHVRLRVIPEISDATGMGRAGTVTFDADE